MSHKYNTEALTKLANHLLNCKNRYEKLKEIGNRQNYSYKVKKLKERLTEDYKFWTTKGGARFADIQRDVKTVSALLNKKEFTVVEKHRINELLKKYPIEL